MTNRRRWVLGVSLIATALTGLAVAARPGSAAHLDLESARPIDLTHAFDERTLYWPTSPSSFALTRLTAGTTPGGWFYAANSFCAPEHGGTHLDAPFHFASSGATTDRVPLSRLVAPAVVLEIARQAAADPDYRLTREDVATWEKQHGTIPKGSIALLRTGWSARWPDRKRYFGDDTPNDASRLHFPSFGEQAARVLILDRHVAAIGVDTASIDYGHSSDFPVHRVAGSADVPAFENLANLEHVPATGAWVVALPMKIAGGSGGPLRIVALVPSGR
jgi:kynurenine formamidase